MSVKVSSWVWHGDETAGLAGNEMILLLALADVAADDGRCVYLTEDDDMTYSGLAKKARVDRRTVIRLIAKLRSRGLVEQRKGTKGQPNEFAISVPWRKGDNLSPLPDSVTTRANEVTPEALFGDITDEGSSLIRKDVIDVASVRPGFAEFYLIYPRKAGKEAARRAWEKAVRGTEPEAIIEGVKRFASDPNMPDKQFIPHPATWLNAGRWDDEPLPARQGGELSEVPDFGRDDWMYRA